MATFTSLGVGSNLDLGTMVDQLTALQRAPLTQMKKEATKLNTQVSSFGKMQSLMGTLQDASNKLTNGTLWSASIAKSGDDTSVSAIGGAGAAPGNYAVSVQALAGSQTLSSSTVFSASTDKPGAGSLTIGRGSWDATRSAFTAASATPVTITIDPKDDLAAVRDKINGANAGVTATLVTDSTGVRLSMRSTDSGAANGFRVQAADADGNNADAAGLSRLAYDPPGGTAGMDFKQAATNAKATVNGIAVESSSNQLSGVVDGLTLNLKKVTGDSNVDIAVTQDRDAVTSAVKSFAEAYNALVSFIGDQTKYDATSKVGGALQGDSAAATVLSQLRAVLATGSGASAAFPRLSDVGLQVQRNGTLLVNDSKLTAATVDLGELKKAFANNDNTTPGNNGFARRYSTLAGQMLGSDGSLTTRSEGLRKLIAKNTDNQAKVNDRADSFKERLVAQYTVMDSNLSKLNALSSYVTAQLAALSKSS